MDDPAVEEKTTVNIHLKPRADGGSPITVGTTLTDWSATPGRAVHFGWYQFNTTIPITTGVSSFDVEVVVNGGSSVTHTNGGAGFPLPDVLLPYLESTCVRFKNGDVSDVVTVIDHELFLTVAVCSKIMQFPTWAKRY